jgi:putative hemolysin
MGRAELQFQNFTRGGLKVELCQSERSLRKVWQFRAAIFRGEIRKEDRDIWDDTYLNFCIKCIDTNTILGCFWLGIFPNGAAAMQGYSAQFFDLSPLAVFDRPVLELGRFAVDPLQGDLRGNSDVFRLAWGVVTQLVDQKNVSFLFGCSSFKGTRPAAHRAAFRYLYRNNHIAPSRWRPVFHGGYPLVEALDSPEHGHVTDLPPLLRAYLSLGGKVSDHAVCDADLGTTLLFTGVNVAQVPQKRAQRLRAILAAH